MENSCGVRSIPWTFLFLQLMIFCYGWYTMDFTMVIPSTMVNSPEIWGNIVDMVIFFQPPQAMLSTQRSRFIPGSPSVFHPRQSAQIFTGEDMTMIWAKHEVLSPGFQYLKRETLQEINISHLGKRKLIFKTALERDTLVPRRVTFSWSEVWYFQLLMSSMSSRNSITCLFRKYL